MASVHKLLLCISIVPLTSGCPRPLDSPPPSLAEKLERSLDQRLRSLVFDWKDISFSSTSGDKHTALESNLIKCILEKSGRLYGEKAEYDNKNDSIHLQCASLGPDDSQLGLELSALESNHINNPIYMQEKMRTLDKSEGFRYAFLDSNIDSCHIRNISFFAKISSIPHGYIVRFKINSKKELHKRLNELALTWKKLPLDPWQYHDFTIRLEKKSGFSLNEFSENKEEWYQAELSDTDTLLFKDLFDLALDTKKISRSGPSYELINSDFFKKIFDTIDKKQDGTFLHSFDFSSKEILPPLYRIKIDSKQSETPSDNSKDKRYLWRSTLLKVYDNNRSNIAKPDSMEELNQQLQSLTLNWKRTKSDPYERFFTQQLSNDLYETKDNTIYEKYIQIQTVELNANAMQVMQNLWNLLPPDNRGTFFQEKMKPIDQCASFRYVLFPNKLFRFRKNPINIDELNWGDLTWEQCLFEKVSDPLKYLTLSINFNSAMENFYPETTNDERTPLPEGLQQADLTSKSFIIDLFDFALDEKAIEDHLLGIKIKSADFFQKVFNKITIDNETTKYRYFFNLSDLDDQKLPKFLYRYPLEDKKDP